ncbi:DUF6247 family protein [Nocardia sp. NBC_01327]|uniref:DUF6247 family protein n=1 Tax=Nocardia sp. NBC_01327 TaxID=2903593 RepID=UPI002E0F4F62|nr:DUF6247 family protein [Nocardia sp. NBC_01327]
MAAPHHDPAHQLVPAAEPEALRAALPPPLREEFDSEWESVLEDAKKSHTLVDIHALLNKWQHTAAMEFRDPGSYQRMLDKAARILEQGGNPHGGTLEDMLAHIERRRRAL